MKWICKQAKKIWPGILLLTTVGGVLSLMGVAFALLSKQVLDIATGQGEGSLVTAGLFLTGALVIQLILEILLSVTDVHVKGKFQMLIQRSRKKKLGVGTSSSTKCRGYETHYIIMLSQ